MLEKPGLIFKLSAPHTGPYRITHTYTNGTVRIQCGIVNERVNIRPIPTVAESAAKSVAFFIRMSQYFLRLDK